jgi:hypothetical protein
MLVNVAYEVVNDHHRDMYVVVLLDNWFPIEPPIEADNFHHWCFITLNEKSIYYLRMEYHVQ